MDNLQKQSNWGREDVLCLDGITTHISTPRGEFAAISDINLIVRRGETVALVGESGSGKSITCLSLMGLIEKPASIVSGKAWFQTKDSDIIDLVKTPENILRTIRGNEIAMIPQDPMTSLNPVLRIGDQITEVIHKHQQKTKAEARETALRMLEKVGISDPDTRLHQYPHQLSGGMRQRVMIAMALICQPALLIADEATTALDVTIQAQILDLLANLQSGAKGMSILFVTHNMGIVAEIADRVIIMYAGRVIETGPVQQVFKSPRHPYTKGLLDSIPRVNHNCPANSLRQRITPIPGIVPDPVNRPVGCKFSPRCAYAAPACLKREPQLEQTTPERQVRCIRWKEITL